MWVLGCAGRGLQSGMGICVGRHGGWGMYLLSNDLCLWRWVCVAVWGMQCGTVGVLALGLGSRSS